MEAKVEFVTPKMAEMFLHCGAANRPVRRKHVEYLAGAIQRGEWKANGEAIIFDAHGKMIDGQHRCHAVIQAGRGVKALVVRGVENGSFETIDRGAGRSNTDALFMDGEKNYMVLSAILKLIKEIENETVSQPRKLSAVEQRKILDEHPLARDWASRQAAIHKAMAGTTQMCAVLCLVEERCGNPAREFYAEIASGANLSEGSPVLALRNRLASDRLLRNSGAQVIRQQICNLVARAWNCYARGDKIVKLYENKVDTVYNLQMPGAAK